MGVTTLLSDTNPTLIDSSSTLRELCRADIRQVIVGDYRVIYRVKRKTPEVISVRHCRFLIQSIRSL